MITNSPLLNLLAAVGLLSPTVTYGADYFTSSPLAFEPNRGQWPASADFGTRSPGVSTTFHNAAVTYYLHSEKPAAITARWLNTASYNARAEPLDPLPGVANYYLGSDSSRWISNLPTFKRLKISQLYPGIDVIYYGNPGHLEYDLIVAPHAHPSRIAFTFDSASAPHLNPQGDLVLDTPAGPFIQHRPVAYQEIAGRRQSVTASYIISRDHTIKLALGKYDPRLPLVIDPTIAWAQTIGANTISSSGGRANAIGVDAAGNVLVAGFTTSPTLPLVNASGFRHPGPFLDAFITKFSADGQTILYSTYFGGTNDDSATGLAVDSAGNAIIVGTTNSTDLSTYKALQPASGGNGDAFIAKFSPVGDIVFATYLGGSSGETARGVAVDPAGNIYLTGSTYSPDFPLSHPWQPTLNGLADGFVTKLSADGSALLFSTFIGGSKDDIPSAIAVGPAGSVYITGYSNSTDFPTLHAYQAAGGTGLPFVARFDTSGSTLLYSTFITSLSGTLPSGLDVDPTSAAYITGQASTGNVFLTKLAPSGSSLMYATTFGGTTSTPGTARQDQGTAVRVDASGNATVVGITNAIDFPTIAALRPQSAGQEGFITRFNPAGDTILFSSYVGGNNIDGIYALALDAAGNTFLAGSTASSDFPSTTQPHSEATFVAKLSGPTTSVPVTFTTVPAGLLLTIDGNTLTTPVTFQWAPGVNHQISAPSPQGLKLHVSNFQSWSNGGAQTQTLITPAAATTLTANFDDQACVSTILPPTSAAYGEQGGSGTIMVNIQPGCLWPVVSVDSWIILGSLPGASTTIPYSVAPNPSGTTRTGKITVLNSTFTITQSFTPPVISSTAVCCSATNSGISQTITYSLNDNDGTSDLTVTNVLINSAIDGRHACYLAFDHANSILYLVDDAGANLLPGMTFDGTGHGIGVISNSQCAVDGPRTSFSNSPSQVDATVTLGLTFSSAFAGNKVIYFAARDKELNNTGWMPLRTWNVPAAPTYPAVVFVNAGTITAGAATSISATYQDATSNTNLTPSQILINSALDGRNACYIGYDHTNNILYLVNDAGNALLPGITPGSGTATQQNSQCVIYAAGTSITPSGASYTLQLFVSFMPAFQGPKIVYGATQTSTGGNSGWQAMRAIVVQ